jgi:hypothetical protein
MAIERESPALLDESPKVAHHRQVIHGGVHAGIEQRVSVLRCRQPEEHIAEITRKKCGPS